MSKLSKVLFICTSLAWASYGNAWAQPGRNKVVEGNTLYTEERYDEALNKYRDALVEAPESPVIKFNIGAAQYKKKKYDEAIQESYGSLGSDDVLKQAKSYYNIGNSLYRLGKLPESIMAYKKSLELNPDDEDAKYNLELVRRQLKDQAQKQQQNSEQQQQQQQQDQDQQEDQQQQEQDKQEQQEQQQQQQAQMSEEEISKEDAQRILDALKEDQEKLKDARKQQIPGNFRVSKDW